MNVLYGILIPFLGTTFGAACVFFLKKEIAPKMQKFLLGFAAGVMTAASVWSLLIPAIDASEKMGTFAFVPATVGFALGIAFLFLLDILIPHLHVGSDSPEGMGGKKLGKNAMMFFAVTLHNIPEGMAVGVVFAAFISGGAGVEVGLAAAMALSLGIAVQNFPEGAIISMSLAGSGERKSKAFAYGVVSGVVEPIAAVVTILLKQWIVSVLPYLLAFAAGAMIYVVVEELIPESSAGEHSNLGTIGFSLGFVVMMVLDVALG